MKNDKRGVFGLESVKLFFGIIAVIALIGFVIIVVMGTLEDTQIAGFENLDATAFVNESVTLSVHFSNSTTVASARSVALTNVIVINVNNLTSIAQGNISIVQAGNYTISGGNFLLIQNATGGSDFNGSLVLISATANFKANQTRPIDVASNTSQWVVDFFSKVSSVWVVLAIMVVILVLIVLVRVVNGKRDGEL